MGFGKGLWKDHGASGAGDQGDQGKQPGEQIHPDGPASPSLMACFLASSKGSSLGLGEERLRRSLLQPLAHLPTPASGAEAAAVEEL